MRKGSVSTSGFDLLSKNVHNILGIVTLFSVIVGGGVVYGTIVTKLAANEVAVKKQTKATERIAEKVLQLDGQTREHSEILKDLNMTMRRQEQIMNTLVSDFQFRTRGRVELPTSYGENDR